MSGHSVTSEYRAAMRRRHLARATIYARMNEIGRWIEFVGEWSTATADDVERFMDTRSLGVRAHYTALSHLTAFYAWAWRRGLVESNPAEKVERPRLPRQIPRPARMELVSEAIDSAPPGMAVRLALMVDAGLRCCEVASVSWHDIDLEVGVVYVTGKGGHERMVGIPGRLSTLIGVLGLVEDPVGRLFDVSAGNLSRSTNEYLRAAGVGATCHQLRHLYATRMLAATGDITAVQQALGHASVSSTQIYAQINPVTALDAARRLVA